MARVRTAARKKSSVQKTSTRAKPAKSSRRKLPTKSVRAKAPGSAARLAKPRRPKQRVAISHHREEDFAAGLRSYAQYRDLGIADATQGMVRAHVLRFV